MPISAVGTAHTECARVARIEITTPAHAYTAEAVQWVAQEMTRIARAAAEDAGLRVWVIVIEAAEGGWGLGGFACSAKDLDAMTLYAAAVAA